MVIHQAEPHKVKQKLLLKHYLNHCCETAPDSDVKQRLWTHKQLYERTVKLYRNNTAPLYLKTNTKHLSCIIKWSAVSKWLSQQGLWQGAGPGSEVKIIHRQNSWLYSFGDRKENLRLLKRPNSGQFQVTNSQECLQSLPSAACTSRPETRCFDLVWRDMTTKWSSRRNHKSSPPSVGKPPPHGWTRYHFLPKSYEKTWKKTCSYKRWGIFC